MTLESQVCSLELARRLKELGVKSESYFKWHGAYHAWELKPDNETGSNISAFTVAELGELLPTQVKNQTRWFELRLPNPDGMKETSRSGGYVCTAHVIDGFPERLYWNSWQGTEADARAHLLIYLLENELMILAGEDIEPGDAIYLKDHTAYKAIKPLTNPT